MLRRPSRSSDVSVMRYRTFMMAPFRTHRSRKRPLVDPQAHATVHRAAGPVSRFHLHLRPDQPATARRGRHASLLRSHPSLRPSDGRRTREVALDAARPAGGKKHGVVSTMRATPATAPAATVPFLCAEVLGGSAAGMLMPR